jgi:hypothetical protein
MAQSIAITVTEINYVKIPSVVIYFPPAAIQYNLYNGPTAALATGTDITVINTGKVYSTASTPAAVLALCNA